MIEPEWTAGAGAGQPMYVEQLAGPLAAFGSGGRVKKAAEAQLLSAAIGWPLSSTFFVPHRGSYGSPPS